MYYIFVVVIKGLQEYFFSGRTILITIVYRDQLLYFCTLAVIKQLRVVPPLNKLYFPAAPLSMSADLQSRRGNSLIYEINITWRFFMI